MRRHRRLALFGDEQEQHTDQRMIGLTDNEPGAARSREARVAHYRAVRERNPAGETIDTPLDVPKFVKLTPPESRVAALSYGGGAYVHVGFFYSSGVCVGPHWFVDDLHVLMGDQQRDTSRVSNL
jgi:hypothetical protein